MQQHTLLYFTSFLFSLFILSDSNRKENYYGAWSALRVTSLLLISFMVFTTFFIISIDPLWVGQPFVSRFLAISLPLSYIIILGFIACYMKSKPRLWLIAPLIIIPFYLSPSINKYIRFSKQGNSIGERAACYRTFAKRLEEADCLRSRTNKKYKMLKYVPQLIPRKYKTPNVDKFISVKIETDKDGIYWKRTATRCSVTLSIPPICN